MKLIGAVLLAIGLGLGIYALTMDVGLEVPSKNLGFGISTPSLLIANPDLVAKRQDYLIFSGILTIAGAILLAFSAKSKNGRKE